MSFPACNGFISTVPGAGVGSHSSSSMTSALARTASPLLSRTDPGRLI
jgi:hypothetical protein